jgi:hypothetical protein
VSRGRIVPSGHGSGTGNRTFTFPIFQTGLRISSHDGPIEFKYRTYNNANHSFVFKLYPGEIFDECTDPFRELVITANDSDRWSFTGFVDLDGPGPYLVSTYDEFSD